MGEFLNFLLVTDAWYPQTNGVVVYLDSLRKALIKLGHHVEVIQPGLFPRKSLPQYPEIELATTPWRMRDFVDFHSMDVVHIPTEGTLGFAARILCLNRNIPFSTAVHTKFPEYAKILAGIPSELGYLFLRWFHKPAMTTVLQSASQHDELTQKGFHHLSVVGGGVDTDLFCPKTRTEGTKPRLLFVGRVSKEKSVEDFLKLPIEADKVVVGDGPDRLRLQEIHPDSQFLGYRFGEELVEEYAQADCLVFPSRTDTFGLTIVEAMACGTPVAAYPVTGPRDVIKPAITGVLSEQLIEAVIGALKLDRERIRQESLHHSWLEVAKRFISAHNPNQDVARSKQIAA